jgi:hypothetical protein
MRAAGQRWVRSVPCNACEQAQDGSEAAVKNDQMGRTNQRVDERQARKNRNLRALAARCSNNFMQGAFAGKTVCGRSPE